jgi:hypothetical protein
MTAAIGDCVQLRRPLPYLKTADPMPMLRPADLVSTEETGELVGMRPLNTGVVRFRRGTFLIPLDQLEVIASTSD